MSSNNQSVHTLPTLSDEMVERLNNIISSPFPEMEMIDPSSEVEVEKVEVEVEKVDDVEVKVEVEMVKVEMVKVEMVKVEVDDVEVEVNRVEEVVEVEVEMVEVEVAVPGVMSKPLTLENMPDYVIELYNNGFEPSTILDLISAIGKIVSTLFNGGASDPGESENDFFTRISPFIIEHMISLNIISPEMGESSGMLITKFLNLSIDMLENITSVDINKDGVIGKSSTSPSTFNGGVGGGSVEGDEQPNQLNFFEQLAQQLLSLSDNSQSSEQFDDELEERPRRRRLFDFGCFR